MNQSIAEVRVVMVLSCTLLSLSGCGSHRTLCDSSDAHADCAARDESGGSGGDEARTSRHAVIRESDDAGVDHANDVPVSRSAAVPAGGQGGAMRPRNNAAGRGGMGGQGGSHPRSDAGARAASGGAGARAAAGMSASGSGGESGGAGASGMDALATAGEGGMSGRAEVSAGAGGGAAGAPVAGMFAAGSAGSAGVSGSSAGVGAGAAGAAAVGGSAAPACPSAVASDAHAAQRDMCTFGSGTLARDSLDITAEQQAAIPVRHVIVMMKENRSYDHYFGQLNSHGQPDSEAVPPSFTNLDAQKQAVAPFHLTTTCLKSDPGHQWQEMHDQVDGGAMDGFVTSAARTTLSDGHFVMGYYDDRDIPFYYFLANTFALADRHFAPVRSGTAPDRDYLLLGTSDGVRESNAGFPSTMLPTLFTRLDDKGVSWAAYTDAVPFEGAINWMHSHAGVHDISELKRALADGSLPAVSFVDSKEDVEDEHPTADVQVGEAWTRDIYQAVIASPLWSSMALIWTYDEAGGFADHVPPPNACVASPSESAFFERGARVPTMVISPWARTHFVSHVVRDHTAILRFIETVFDLPALTARDANSDALLDMFDFRCAPRLNIPDAPPAGTGGCH